MAKDTRIEEIITAGASKWAIDYRGLIVATFDTREAAEDQINEWEIAELEYNQQMAEMFEPQIGSDAWIKQINS